MYDWGGPAAAPTLLLGHATGLHGHMWLPLAQRLADRFRCISLDFRGHGVARRPDDGAFLWDGFGDDMVAALDGMRLARRGDVYAIGHSMGGAALCMGELVRPATFEAMVLFEPIIFPAEYFDPTAGPNIMSESARRRREVFGSREEARQNYASKQPWMGVDADALDAYVQYGFVDLANGTVRLACRSADEARTFEGSPRSSFVFERAGDVRCPVTVMAGVESGEDRLALSQRQADAFANGTLVALPGRTHFGPFEDVDGFAQIVLDVFGLG